MTTTVQDPYTLSPAQLANSYNTAKVFSHPPMQLAAPTVESLTNGVLKVADDAIRTKDVNFHGWVGIAIAVATIAVGIFVCFSTLGAGLITIGIGLVIAGWQVYNLSRKDNQDKVVSQAAQYVASKSFTTSQGERAVEMQGEQAQAPQPQKIRRQKDLRGSESSASSSESDRAEKKRAHRHARRAAAEAAAAQADL